MISDEYVDRILYVIEGSTIRKKELKDDLTDHFCCMVEMDMKRGMSFDDAFVRAQEQTCPNGLDEIQRETIFLLNYNRIMFMKRLMFLIGCLSSIALAAGVFFKLMYLPGASTLLLLGMVGLVLLFLPMVLVDKFKHLGSQGTIEKFKWIFGLLSALSLVTGSVFKIFHLQGAGVLLGLAFLLFCLGFLPLLFFRMYKNSIEEL